MLAKKRPDMAVVPCANNQPNLIELYVYITKVFEFEYDRFYRFLCNFKEYS